MSNLTKIDPLYYCYILEHNNKHEHKFFYKINETNSFLNKQDFKNFINFLKTQKKLKWNLKKEWCMSPTNKRILWIEFSGLYSEFWSTGKGLEDYHNLFINN